MISKKVHINFAVILTVVVALIAVFRLNDLNKKCQHKNRAVYSELQASKKAREAQQVQDNPLIFENLADSLMVYDIYDANNEKHKIVRHGREGDGGYIVPEIALQSADVLLGYGIASDISFEELFSDIYKKPSYGFDCGTEIIGIKNPLCNFIRECISSDSTLNGDQKSSNVISTFTQQLNKLNLIGKKVFIKMDIEGSEYDAFEDIYKYAPNITGIVLELHDLSNVERALRATHLLTRLSHDFYIVHIHGNNCCRTFPVQKTRGGLPKVLEATFINKSLVNHAQISSNQSHPLPYDNTNIPGKEDIKFEITNAE